jgi:hypothetical protein
MREIMKIFGGICFTIAVISGCGSSSTNTTNNINQPIANPPGDQIVCAQDSMQCPNGIWVSRTGANCEFVCP